MWPLMPIKGLKMNSLVAVDKIAQWEKLKTLVLDSVSSPITKRVYNMALNEFMAWFQQMPCPGFTKATVGAWRVSLEERRLGSSSIIIRMSAIRKLAAEAADNGLLTSELAQGISHVKSVKSTGIRVGNWLSQKQAQALLTKSPIPTANADSCRRPSPPQRSIIRILLRFTTSIRPTALILFPWSMSLAGRSTV
jgi:site-specific recombinase XerC